MSSVSSSSADSEIVFVTGNSNKVRELGQILEGFTITSKKLDFHKIQGPPVDVSVHKCNTAFKMLGNKSVLTEDSSLGAASYNGLPCVYTGYFQKMLGNEGLYEMLQGRNNVAFASCFLCYRRPSDNGVHVFHGFTPGYIVPPRGNKGFSWDPIFLPEGKEMTFGEMEPEEKNKISPRYEALQLFKEFLLMGECTPGRGYRFVPDS